MAPAGGIRVPPGTCSIEFYGKMNSVLILGSDPYLNQDGKSLCRSCLSIGDIKGFKFLLVYPSVDITG